MTNNLPVISLTPGHPLESFNIFQRLLGIMEDIDYIQKGQKEAVIGQQQYRFVSHDQVAAKLHPLFVKWRVLAVPSMEEMTQDGNRTRVKLVITFRNVDNPNEGFFVTFFGYGCDSGDKGPGKAVSYAFKYALLKMFCLETGDDPDNDQGAVYEPEKCAQFDSMTASWDQETLKGFLKQCSSATGKGVEDVKREALNRFDDFGEALKKWSKKNKPVKIDEQ